MSLPKDTPNAHLLTPCGTNYIVLVDLAREGAERTIKSLSQSASVKSGIPSEGLPKAPIPAEPATGPTTASRTSKAALRPLVTTLDNSLAHPHQQPDHLSVAVDVVNHPAGNTPQTSFARLA